MSYVGDISAAVSPEALKSYLVAEDWHFDASVRANSEIWRRDGNEILLPLSASAPDYSRRVRNFVEDLARTRQTSDEDIARELMYIEDDVVDIAIADVKDVVPLDVANRIIGNARKLAIASACSAIARKAYHGHSRPFRARKAASIVGMGHTRRDCFIIPLISPAASLRPWILDDTMDEQTLDLGLGREPDFFSRRVTGMMASALRSIHNLAVQADRSPDQASLQAAVLDGLSADACEATARMITGTDASTLDVTFRWALTAVPPRVGREEMEFPMEAVKRIEQVGGLLRQQVTVDNQVLYGYVYSLERDAGDPDGTVKIRAWLQGRVRPVKVTLNSDFYSVASDANDQRVRVVVAGQLRRSSTGLFTMPQVESLRFDDYMPMITTDEWRESVRAGPSGGSQQSTPDRMPR